MPSAHSHATDLPRFLDKWSASSGSERANKDSFLCDLCDLL